MTTDVPFHYPPELFNLLVDTIPLLNRSKNPCFTTLSGILRSTPAMLRW